MTTTCRDAAPLVDWLEPLRTDTDFTERTAEIDAALDAIRAALDEMERLTGGVDEPEMQHLLGCIETAIFGPYTGIEIEVDE